jgi:hypothetical protein
MLSVHHGRRRGHCQSRAAAVVAHAGNNSLRMAINRFTAIISAET